MKEIFLLAPIAFIFITSDGVGKHVAMSAVDISLIAASRSEARDRSIFAAQKQPEDTIEADRPGAVQCEWSPTRKRQAAPIQCGFNDAGVPNQAWFDCGVKRNAAGNRCEDFCVFVDCYTP
jgi:hypothetical protein